MTLRTGLAIAFLLASTTVQAQDARFDGTYRGEAAGGGCSVFTPVLRVKDGTATLHFNPSINFEGKVASDGAIDTQHGQSTLTGEFAGTNFQGYI